MSDNIIIEVKNLSKIYPIYIDKKDRLKEALSITRKKYHKDFHALSNISFEVKKGETLGIIGQNGSGKSTLLKILTGVLSQTSGSVEVNGKVSALLELGAGFNPEMTGIENIYLNGTIMGYTKDEMDARIPKIIDFADIGEFIDQPVKMYSSGMFARLAFAVAINVEPDILIVDEALSVGDMFFQNKCFRKMEEIKQNGTTIIFVSHDLVSVKQLCSKVLWLNKGIVCDFGLKTDVCEKYLSFQLELNNSENEQTIDLYDSEKHDSYQTISSNVVFPDNAKASDKDIVSEKIKILSFFIKDNKGNITKNIITQNKYSFHIVAQSFEDLKNVIYGFTMEDRKGIPIFTTNTFIESESKVLDNLKDNIYEVRFEIDFPKIHSGEYLISPAIAVGTQDVHKILTWLHNKEMITIENNGYNLAMLELTTEISINLYDKEKVTFA